MGRFAIIFLPLFVVVGLFLFRRMFSAERRAGYTSGGRWVSALASWLLTALMWSIVIYLAFLAVLFFVFQVDFAAFWRALGS